jgi:hypothetical protein
MDDPKLIATAKEANWIIAGCCSECGEPIMHTDPSQTDPEVLNRQLQDAFKQHLADCSAKYNP